MAVIAADLQEPPDLVLEFHRVLSSGAADVVMGHRIGRADPFWSQMLSDAFWRLYRRFVVRDMPQGRHRRLRAAPAPCAISWSS